MCIVNRYLELMLCLGKLDMKKQTKQNKKQTKKQNSFFVKIKTNKHVCTSFLSEASCHFGHLNNRLYSVTWKSTWRGLYGACMNRYLPTGLFLNISFSMSGKNYSINSIVQFELAYCNVAVQHVNHYTTETPTLSFWQTVIWHQVFLSNINNMQTNLFDPLMRT